VRALRETVEGLVLARQKQKPEHQHSTSLAKKFKWAIVDQRELEKLLEDVTKLEDGLDNLFPSVQPQRQQLAGQEVQKIVDQVNGGLRLLQDTANSAAKQDKVFKEALSKELGQRAQHTGTVSQSVNVHGNTEQGVHGIDFRNGTFDLSRKA
jgi:hypothetical protein